MDDPTLLVHRSINELVYDTLGYLIVEPDFVAYGLDSHGYNAQAAVVGDWESLDPNFYAAIRVRRSKEALPGPRLRRWCLQSEADTGPAAFSAACEQYGAPAVLNVDSASVGGVDISAYGFATGESEDSDDEGMDVEAELKQLSAA
ncbi:hypothetical protein CYMTET_49898 [Cymbomonas tetramitiformis]|uniref:Uncharacterized protein n=1 Tax=Cymbomonas tetramitiformis TaxID=36881 RepID=A0AAE0BQN1_9CHLO|nr:hypothetical protein CYMTET_49898 [Cymbomonas tetramitiformis]